VCAQLRSWSDRLPKQNLFLSINLTRRQLFNSELTVQLMKALAASGANPLRLVFEIPESALNETPDAAVAVLQRLTDCQVRVAIDDFGSSLAPLNHLLQLPISMVKLASRLTAAAVSGGRQQAVLEAFIRLANTLNLPVVAQGIETREQVAALVRMGCTLGQGTLMSPPLDPERALELAQTGSRAASSRA
jgi:EAL domain-containing protein (putative c-di-GMP-specific phosphodiesterase class I)